MSKFANFPVYIFIYVLSLANLIFIYKTIKYYEKLFKLYELIIPYSKNSFERGYFWVGLIIQFPLLDYGLNYNDYTYTFRIGQDNNIFIIKNVYFSLWIYKKYFLNDIF